jgi:hypothetical protein
MATLLLSITIHDAMPFLSLQRLVLSAALAAACSGAFAQYVWLDNKGMKQYSDVPPPAEVPASRILKTPGSRTAPAADIPPPVEPSLAEREAEFRKRRAQASDGEREAEDKRKRQVDIARVCEQARAYGRALESGQRIGRVDPSGERQYLDDSQKAKEAAEVQRVLATCLQ